MNKRFNLLIITFIFAILLGGCTLPWQKKKVVEETPVITEIPIAAAASSSTGQMKKFADYSELQTFLEKNVISSPSYYRGGRPQLINGNLDMAFGGAEMLSTKAMSSNQAGVVDDYSKTNVQVAGVDEADIIKTDGQYIYVVSYNDLYIIKATPAAQTKAVSKITFNSRPSELFLDNGKLVVIGADNQIMTSSVYKNFRRQSPYTFVKIFDLTDPESPKQVRDLDFEGSYTDSRIVDGRLYLILNNYNDYIPGESLVPRLVDGGKILANACTGGNRCFAPDVYYFDVPYDAYNFTSVNTLDLRDQEASVLSQTYLLNNTQTIYVSAKNLFITSVQYLDESVLRLAVMRDLFTSKLSQDEQNRIVKIDATDVDILNSAEKSQKIIQIFDRYFSSRSPEEMLSLETELTEALKLKYEAEADNLERTQIHRIALNSGQPVYRANGSVPGAVLNQFSLDEDDLGNLRIATTRSNNFNSFSEVQQSSSGLYVLSPDLKNLGSVEGLAPGERIYSVRFLGKRAYLVTFKQTDPLFVIDLSSAQAPKLLGQLKVPGFSSYLHPYDENTLIGLGKDTQTDVYGNVKTGGIKLSLFDVTDAANPKELDSYIAGGAGSDSLALNNHKAFLFSRDKNLLLIPASLTSAVNNYRTYFSGALVFGIDNGKFNLRGQIDHSDGGKYQRSDYWCGSSCFDNSVQRGLYISDSLYTFSNKYIKVNNLGDLSSLQAIKLIPDTAVDLEVTPMPQPVVSDEPGEPIVNVAPVGPSLPPVTPVFTVETTTTTPQVEAPVEIASSTETINLENGVINPTDINSSSPLLP